MTGASVRVGLRFARRDARLLRTLAERARSHELGEQAVATFSSAATAALTGEPLIVYCTTPLEAVVMADGYVRYGVQRPAIEELTGHRPAN